MTTKDSIKQQVDQLPEDLLGKVERFIQSLVRPARSRNPLSGYKLGGRFDKISIRENAYE